MHLNEKCATNEQLYKSGYCYISSSDPVGVAESVGMGVLMVSVKAGMSGVIALVVLVIISAAMLPLLTETIADVDADGTVGTLLTYMPLFVVLGIALAVIMYAVGFIGGGKE